MAQVNGQFLIDILSDKSLTNIILQKLISRYLSHGEFETIVKNAAAEINQLDLKNQQFTDLLISGELEQALTISRSSLLSNSGLDLTIPLEASYLNYDVKFIIAKPKNSPICKFQSQIEDIKSFPSIERFKTCNGNINYCHKSFTEVITYFCSHNGYRPEDIIELITYLDDKHINNSCRYVKHRDNKLNYCSIKHEYVKYFLAAVANDNEILAKLIYSNFDFDKTFHSLFKQSFRVNSVARSDNKTICPSKFLEIINNIEPNRQICTSYEDLPNSINLKSFELFWEEPDYDAVIWYYCTYPEIFTDNFLQQSIHRLNQCKRISHSNQEESYGAWYRDLIDKLLEFFNNITEPENILVKSSVKIL